MTPTAKGTTRERKAAALAVQEMVLAVWMTASGFRPGAVSTTSERADGGTLAGVWVPRRGRQ